MTATIPARVVPVTDLPPPDDLIKHEHGIGCVCGPVVVPIISGTGVRSALLGHQRLAPDPQRHGMELSW